MKQVLVHSNNTYLFPLPQTYLSLVKEISNKTNLCENNISIYHKGHYITKNNFQDINENLNILDVQPKLNGGGGFPNFTIMFIVAIVQTILTSIVGSTILISFSTILKSLIEPDDKGHLSDAFGTLKLVQPFNQINWLREILYASIIFYIFSFAPAIAISVLKNNKCPTYKPPWTQIGIASAAPIPLLLVICGLQTIFGKQSSNPSLIYLITGAVFAISGYFIMSSANNSLQEWEHEESKTDLYVIPFYATGWYLVLRILLLRGNNEYSIGGGMVMTLITFLFVAISIFPDFIDAYLRYISSPFSQCPQ